MRQKFICLLLLLISSTGYGQWLCPWENRQCIRVKEKAGENLVDYQLKIEVPFAIGMSADYSDLRFTANDGTTLLNFYLETYTATRAIVWVKIPSLPSGSTLDIFYYYCNPLATSASDPKNTFLFYDDFESFAGWQQYGQGLVSQDLSTFPGISSLKKGTACDPGGGYKNLGQSISSFRLLTREQRRNEGNSCSLNRYGLEGNGHDGYSLRRSAVTNGNGSFGFERRNNGSGSNYQSTNLSQPHNNWYRTELTRCDDNNGTLEAKLFDDTKTEIGSKSGQDNTYSTFDKVVIHGGHPYFFDFIAVGKYVCEEPTIRFKNLESDEPIASCMDITVALDADGQYTLDPMELDGGSTDCNTLEFVASIETLTCDDLGVNKVDVKISDEHGNSDECSAKITVVDTIAPIATCPEDVTVVANSNGCSAIVTWLEPAVNENCKVDKIEGSHVSGASFFVGTTEVSYKYYDQSNNMGSCSFMITVLSNAATPIITVTESSGNISNDGIICSGDQACLNPTTGFSDYLWSTGDGTEQLCVNEADDYFVVVTNDIGCTATSTTSTISSLEIPVAGTCLISQDYCQLEEGIVRVEVSNGAAPYTVSWLPSIDAVSSGTIQNSGDFLNIENISGGTTVEISIVDDNGCEIN